MPETITAADYLRTLRTALIRIRNFDPTYLVVCFGLDTAKGDPTGTWPHTGRDFTVIWREIGCLRKPSLVIQEGGVQDRVHG